MSGNSRESPAATPSSAAAACGRLTPDASRPSTKTVSARRSSILGDPFSMTGCIASGSQKSGAATTSVPKKPRGATPTMV
jgi:hypothetical protein